MSLVDHSDDLTVEVAALSEETSSQTPASGQDWLIRRVLASPGHGENTHVEIRWGADVIFSSHGTHEAIIDKRITGDGTKELVIALVNDTATPHVMGLSYEAIEPPSYDTDQQLPMELPGS